MKSLDLLTFPLRGSRLIEASAGTGKTFSLALLYVRLVLGHGDEQTAFYRPLTPKDLLVLTFTDAATEELRSRVRQRLVEAARLFRQGSKPLNADVNSTDPLWQLVQSYPASAWPACALRLKRAAEAMDEAMIATIHSWCNKMLTEHAFDSRGLFQRELLTDQTELIDAIVKDYWRQHFYPLSADAAAVVQDNYLNPDRLRKAVRPLLQQADPMLLFAGEPFLLSKFSELNSLIAKAVEARQQWQQQQTEFKEREQAVQLIWAEHWPELQQQLYELQAGFNGTKHFSSTAEKFGKMLSELQQWSEGQAAFAKKMANFATGRFVWKKGKEPAEEPNHPAFVAMASLAELLQQHDSGTESDEGPTVKHGILSHALGWCRQELQRRLNRQVQLGFNDLLTELHQALDPAKSGEHASQLAESIRAAYPVALIDEFQDTDPVQYGIFNRIYRIAANDQQSAVVLIGDPKQAIYSFRGADIYTYLQARQDTTGRHYSLSKNFRSTDAVVAACNQLFQLAEAHPKAAFRFQAADATENPLPFVAVSASDRGEQLLLDGKPVPALEIHHLAGDEPWRTKAYRAEIARHCAARITLLLNASSGGRCALVGEKTRPLAAEDIAILVRSQHEAQVIKAELAKLAVPAVYLSDRGSVFATTEAADVLLWLRTCANPMDLGLVKASLAAPSLGLSLQQLMAWQQDELAMEVQVQFFIRLQGVWRSQGVLAMLRQLLDQYQLPARLLQQQHGERLLTNLLHLADWLQQQAVQLDGEQALIRQLAEHINEPGEEQVIRLESDAALVKIVTIHKSKGLEYPLVFLPFVVGWKEIDGKVRHVGYRTPQGSGTEISGKTAFPQAWQQADDERLSEDMRLLYVALTRARHGLWLGTAAVCSQGKSMQNHQGAFGYLLNGDARYKQPVELQQQLENLTDLLTQHLTQLGTQHLTKQGASLSMQLIENAEPYQSAQSLAQLEAAATPTLPPRDRWWIASYSAIRFTAGVQPGVGIRPQSEQINEPESGKADLQAELFAETLGSSLVGLPVWSDFVMHQLPKGAETGTFVHLLLEWAVVHRYRDQAGNYWQGFAAALHDHDGRAEQLQVRCQALGLTHHASTLSDWMASFLQQSFQLNSTEPLVLAELSPSHIAVEMEFLVQSNRVSTRELDELVQRYILPGVARRAAEPEQLNGMLKGFIDLLVHHQGRYYVLDWKTNSLGADDAAYSQQAMQHAMLSHRYDMQFALYLLALHRLLQSRLVDYDYDTHIGGALYLFVRGCREPEQQGLWQYRPERAFIEQLDALFAGQPVSQPEVQA